MLNGGARRKAKKWRMEVGRLFKTAVFMAKAAAPGATPAVQSPKAKREAGPDGRRPPAALRTASSVALPAASRRQPPAASSQQRVAASSGRAPKLAPNDSTTQHPASAGAGQAQEAEALRALEANPQLNCCSAIGGTD
jgi:hypothetical protein